MNLQELDNYIPRYLYDWMNIRDLVALMKTCRYFYQRIKQCDYLFRRHLENTLIIPRLSFYAQTAYEQLRKMKNDNHRCGHNSSDGS